MRNDVGIKIGISTLICCMLVTGILVHIRRGLFLILLHPLLIWYDIDNIMPSQTLGTAENLF